MSSPSSGPFSASCAEGFQGVEERDDRRGYQKASHHIKTEENPKPYHPDPVMSRLSIPRKNEARRGRHSKQETQAP